MMFGLQNRFHKIDEQIYYENLSQAVCKNGFSDYSAYGITSFLASVILCCIGQCLMILDARVI